MSLKRNFSQINYTRCDTNLDGVGWILSNIKVGVMYPAALTSNLILCFCIVGIHRLRKDPWRWLVAHMAMCIYFYALLVYAELFTTVYHLPSLQTSKYCIAFIIVKDVFWMMVLVSATLLAIERFRAVRNHINEDSKGGMGSKAVILSLLIFWLLVVLIQVLWFTVEAIVQKPWKLYTYGSKVEDYRRKIVKGYRTCHVHSHVTTGVARLVIGVWALATFTTTFFGTMIVGCCKGPSRRSIAIPAVFFMFFFLLFALGPEVCYYLKDQMPPSIIDINVLRTGIAGVILDFCLATAFFLFALTWLITFRPCGEEVDQPDGEEEQIPLKC